MNDRNRWFRWRLAGICAVALVAKAAYLLGAKAGDTDLTDEGDALYYASQAKLNAVGTWFVHPEVGGPGADHPPLTTLVLTPVAWVTDGSILAMRGAMTVLGVVVVAAIGVLGRRIGGDRVGLFAATLATAYAALWVNDALLMSETLAALGTVAVLIAGYRLGDRRDVTSAVVFGAVGALAALARAELALLLPIVGIIVLVSRPGRSHDRDATSTATGTVRLLAVAAGISILVVAPWIGWNLSRFEEPVLLSSNDGLTWIGANCDDTYYTPAIGFWQLRCAFDHPVAGDRSEVAAEWRDIAFDYVSENTDRLPAVVAARLGRTFGVFEPRQMVFFNGNEGREAWVSWLALYQWWTMAVLAVIGAVVAVRRRIDVAPLVAPVVVVVVVTVVFYGLSRFRVPADVVAVVLAAVAVDAAVTGFRRGPAPVDTGIDTGAVGSNHHG